MVRCPSCRSLNQADMRFCGRCGTALQHSLVRERRNVSVIFIDLCGFSTLTRDFDPEVARDIADQMLTIVAGIIEDYDGHVDAFQGDGLIALFGAPHSHPDDPQRAVQAAAAGLRAIEEIGTQKGYSLHGRAGVNTGTVIAGSVGSGRVREYTVMGSAVNLAARLESAAQPGEVWVGPETYEVTKHRMSYETISGISLNGFPNITEAYKLVSLHDSYTLDPYSDIKFIGRERERGLLREALEGTRTPSVQVRWLVGEVGSGKTRLLKEFVKETIAGGLELQPLWLEDSPEIKQMWRQLAIQMFELPEDEPIWQQRVPEQLKELLPDEPRWQNYILRSLNLLEEKPWRRLERRSVDRTLLAWRDFFIAWLQYKQIPALLVLEQSSQSASLGQWIELLQATSCSLLIVQTSRGRDMPLEAQSIHMKPLSVGESLALVEQVASPQMKTATESLIFQVGGVPANILELGRALQLTNQSSFRGSLASLLQARLDMLSSTARHLLAYAALTGERSWEGLLLELIGANQHDILQKLLQENILVRDSSSLIPEQAEYRFQSELFRSAVLRMVPYADRPLLHLQIASWLEKYAPLSLSSLIGYHFKEGKSFEAAYPHYLAAADIAIQGERRDEAYGLFSTLLGLELPIQLLTQGALAFVQAALSQGDNDKATQQLSIAEQWLERCTPEARQSLEEVYARLREDVRRLQEKTIVRQAQQENVAQ
ncbi:MAG: adenylate/guanylate cyclase domain-containing protein [Trueperaceae bacterium]